MTWLLIDGNNWFAQCDYAAPGNSDRTLLYRLQTLTSQVEHSLVAVCWDSGRSFRSDLCSSYKAHRAAKPDDYKQRLANARRIIAEQPGVHSLACEQYEADDLMATMVRIAQYEGERAIMFSADCDLHQLLVHGTVSQVTQVTRETPTKLRFATTTAATLQQRYKVRPDQWVDYRCIVGDKSDGISGCPGLGRVAAAEVLRVYDSLDRFYLSPLAARVTARQRTSLLAFRDQLPLKRRLLTLVDGAPLPASVFGALSGAAP